jgi:hypothetical protein
MLTHVYKVKHLVVGTFEQGWSSWWSGGIVFQWPNAASAVTGLCACIRSVLHSEGRSRSCDWTRRACVGSQVTYADIERELGVQRRRKDRTLPCVRSMLIWRVWLRKFGSGCLLEMIWRWEATGSSASGHGMALAHASVIWCDWRVRSSFNRAWGGFWPLGSCE